MHVCVCVCVFVPCMCVHLSTRLIKCLSLAFVPFYSFSFHFVQFMPLVALRLVRFPFAFSVLFGVNAIEIVINIVLCTLYTNIYCVCYNSCALAHLFNSILLSFFVSQQFSYDCLIVTSLIELKYNERPQND